MKIMKAIEHLSKIYYVPLKRNRLVNDTDGVKPHQQVRDLSQSDAKATQEECQVRWKIELLHREIKQVTGIGNCQCRKMRAQRNHIACCFQVWVFLQRVARPLSITIYGVKKGLLNDYMKQQLSNPSIIFRTA